MVKTAIFIDKTNAFLRNIYLKIKQISLFFVLFKVVFLVLFKKFRNLTPNTRSNQTRPQLHKYYNSNILFQFTLMGNDLELFII